MLIRFITFSLLFLSSLFFTCCSGNSEEADTADPAKPETAVTSTNERGIPVEAMVVHAEAFRENIPLTGVLQPIHEVDLIAEVSGKIVSKYKELGSYVTTQDTLAQIDDTVPFSNYRQAVSQVLSAENNVKIARLNLTSDKQLFENGDISKLAYENSALALKTAEASHLSALANLSLMKKNYQDTRIVSPINGLVARKFIDLGTMVNPGQAVYRVVDLNRLKIEVGIPQAMIGRIQPGGKSKITISALNNRVVEGTVKYLSPQADERTGAFTAEVHIQNTEDLEIRAGLSARVELILTDDSRQISIPDYALVSSNGEDFIYTIRGDQAVLTAVDISETIGSSVLISKGITEGDTIVTVGMKNLGMNTKIWIEQLH